MGTVTEINIARITGRYYVQAQLQCFSDASSKSLGAMQREKTVTAFVKREQVGPCEGPPQDMYTVVFTSQSFNLELELLPSQLASNRP